jgi:CRP/FNR family transcriptional regulator
MDLHVLSDIMIHQKFELGQTIWNDETDVTKVGVVVSGIVKLSKLLFDGQHQIVSLHFASDFLGRVYSSRNDSFAEAVTDVELCCFPARGFERVLHTHPNLEHEVLKRTLDDLTKAREWMAVLGRMTATEKVSSFLLQISRQSQVSHRSHAQPSSNLRTFVLPLKRSEVADYLGLTIETVSRKLSWLKVHNVIGITEGRIIEVCDPTRLGELSGLYDR